MTVFILVLLFGFIKYKSTRPSNTRSLSVTACPMLQLKMGNGFGKWSNTAQRARKGTIRKKFFTKTAVIYNVLPSWGH